MHGESCSNIQGLINGFLSHLEISCNWVGVKDSLHGCKLTFLLGSPETSSEFRGHPRFLKGGQSSLSSDLLLLLLSSPLTSSSPSLPPASPPPPLYSSPSSSSSSPFSSLPFFLPFSSLPSSLCSFLFHPSAGENEQKQVCKPDM